MHHRLPLLAVQRNHFENRVVFGCGYLDSFAAQPQSERGVPDGVLIELGELAQFDFEAVGVGRARRGKEDRAVVNARAQLSDRRVLGERVRVQRLAPIPFGAAPLEPQDDLVPRRQIVFRVGQAQLFGEVGGFVNEVPAVHRERGSQHFEIEQRDRARRVQKLVRGFVNRIEEHRLDAHLVRLGRAHHADADRVPEVERELPPLLPYFPDELPGCPLHPLRDRAGLEQWERLQRDVLGGGDRNADARAAFAGEAFQIVAAEIREQGTRRGRGCLRFTRARPPPVSAVLRELHQPM